MGEIVDFEIGKPHGFNGESQIHTPEPRRPSPAETFLREVSELITGDRAIQHGDFKECHLKIAIMWDAWNKVKRNPLAADTEFDVAVKLALLKLVRTQQGAYNADDMRDFCGYGVLAAMLEPAK